MYKCVYVYGLAVINRQLIDCCPVTLSVQGRRMGFRISQPYTLTFGRFIDLLMSIYGKQQSTARK